jgi:hypothetical protein
VDWEALFADLEGAFDAAEAAGLAAEVEERTRLEAARIQLADRLATLVGRQIRVTVPALGAVPVRLVDLGADWLLVREATGGYALLPFAAVLAVGAAPGAAAADRGVVAERLGLPYALRLLARNRAAVTMVLRDGSTRAGTIDQVGADYVVLAEHARDELRRGDAVRDVTWVPLAALVAVRSR